MENKNLLNPDKPLTLAMAQRVLEKSKLHYKLNGLTPEGEILSPDYSKEILPVQKGAQR